MTAQISDIIQRVPAELSLSLVHVDNGMNTDNPVGCTMLPDVTDALVDSRKKRKTPERKRETDRERESGGRACSAYAISEPAGRIVVGMRTN